MVEINKERINIQVIEHIRTRAYTSIMEIILPKRIYYRFGKSTINRTNRHSKYHIIHIDTKKPLCNCIVRLPEYMELVDIEEEHLCKKCMKVYKNFKGVGK
jgi:hypothetical protein